MNVFIADEKHVAHVTVIDTAGCRQQSDMLS